MSDEDRLRNAVLYGTSHPEIYKDETDHLRDEIERLRAREKAFETIMAARNMENDTLRSDNARLRAELEDNQRMLGLAELKISDLRAAMNEVIEDD